ncbi:uncharacterized protein LOC133800109 [Humulus lupulus]|uniref:uncharacterized protein LOC133800109 n=1 Tax=Humulus lupulus TaxID=3486 RepID=UPI002B401F67|nr:uncharacterized protein LOC133800109 [Humulus lupulus]
MSEPIRQATTSSFPIQDPELARKLAEMEALIQRIPGMPAPIKKSAASCYADSPFVDDIALVEMPKKFNFPNMKMFDGTSDPDDHIAQYRQRMFTFASSRKLEKSAEDLYIIVQRRGEPLREYVGRFNKEKVSITHCNQDTAISAFRKGLRSENRRREYNRSSETRLRDGPKIPEYNLSISPVEVVGVLKGLGDKVKWPERMRTPSNQRDKAKWCEFHNDHGHRTDECIALKLEVSNLLKRGHLTDLLTDKGKRTFQQEADRSVVRREVTPPKPPTHERTVNVITGGSEVSGVTHSAAKRHARQTNWVKGESSETEKNTINLPAQTISFSTTESTRLLNPHHDALVIALYIANCLTKRILIDNGSSANILFFKCSQGNGDR